MADRSRRPSGASLGLAGILTAALALRLWGIKHGLPFVYNIDESANFVPSAVGFFFTDSYNPHYFINPPAFSYLLHLVFAFWFGGGWPFGSKYEVGEAYAVDPTQVFVVARATSAVLGTAAVAFVYLTAKRLFDARVGLLSAAVIACAFLPVFYSHLALNDVPALFALCVSIYGSAGVMTRGRPVDYVLAALGLGLAAATKYTAGIAAVPLLVAIVHQLCAGRESARRALRGTALATLIALASFVVANPHALLSFNEFWEGIRTQESESGFSKLGLTQDSGVVYYLWTLTWGLGWIPAVATIAGAGFAIRDDRWRAAFLLVWPLLLVVFLGLQSRYFGRWIIPALPALCILAGLAVVRGAELISSRGRVRNTLIAVFGIALVGQGLVYSVHGDRVLSRADTRNELRAWMVDNVAPGTKVVVEPVVPERWFTDPGIPTPVSESGRRWIKFPTGRSLYDNQGRKLSGGVGRTVKPEDYERILRPSLIDSYAAGGYCYVVIASTQYGRAFRSREQVPKALSYYRSLGKRGEVLKRFTPYRPGQGPVEFNFDWSFDHYPLAYERPGPNLIVYRLQEGRCARPG